MFSFTLFKLNRRVKAEIVVSICRSDEVLYFANPENEVFDPRTDFVRYLTVQCKFDIRDTC